MGAAGVDRAVLVRAQRVRLRQSLHDRQRRAHRDRSRASRPSTSLPTALRRWRVTWWSATGSLGSGGSSIRARSTSLEHSGPRSCRSVCRDRHDVRRPPCRARGRAARDRAAPRRARPLRLSPGAAARSGQPVGGWSAYQVLEADHQPVPHPDEHLADIPALVVQHAGDRRQRPVGVLESRRLRGHRHVETGGAAVGDRRGDQLRAELGPAVRERCRHRGHQVTDARREHTTILLPSMSPRRPTGLPVMTTGHIDPRYGDATAAPPARSTSTAGSATPRSTGWSPSGRTAGLTPYPSAASGTTAPSRSAPARRSRRCATSRPTRTSRSPPARSAPNGWASGKDIVVEGEAVPGDRQRPTSGPSRRRGKPSTTGTGAGRARDRRFFELSSTPVEREAGEDRGGLVFRVPPDQGDGLGDAHGQTTYRP